MLSGRNDLTYKVYLKAGLNHTHVLSRISVNRLNFRALLFAVEISEELITGAWEVSSSSLDSPVLWEIWGMLVTTAPE